MRVSTSVLSAWYAAANALPISSFSLKEKVLCAKVVSVTLQSEAKAPKTDNYKIFAAQGTRFGYQDTRFYVGSPSPLKDHITSFCSIERNHYSKQQVGRFDFSHITSAPDNGPFASQSLFVNIAEALK